MLCFEQILKATSHKTTAVQPLTFHLTNHPSKTNILGIAREVKTNS